MKALVVTFSCLLIISAALSETVVDGIKLGDKKTEKGVVLESGKKGDVRIYRAEINKEIEGPMSEVMTKITNFEEKCNNKYKRRRKDLDRKFECPYKNQNLVESFVIRDIKKVYKAEKYETDRWVIKRRVYKRGTYVHNDLLTIKRFENAKKQKTVEIKHIMIPEEEAKKYIDNPADNNEPFDFITGTYTLTEIAPGETLVNYVYLSKTDHFLLNKDIAVGQVYSSMASGTSLAIDTIVVGMEDIKKAKSKTAKNDQKIVLNR
ncbi:MAG: hypothetical protein HOE90_04515 [Bacteriovoracaceae bacterium]|nr:hypothetical protein [Bacteriovoracaceae bacterium]